MPIADTLRRIDFSQYTGDHRRAMFFFYGKNPVNPHACQNDQRYRLRRSRSMEAVREAYSCLSQLTEDELYELEDRRLIHRSVPTTGLTEVGHVLEEIDERGEVEIDGYGIQQFRRVLDGFIQVRSYAARN